MAATDCTVEDALYINWHDSAAAQGQADGIFRLTIGNKK